MMKTDTTQAVDRQIVKVLTTALNDLVGACMDESGNLKAPSKKDLMKARSMLPAGFEHTLTKKD